MKRALICGTVWLVLAAPRGNAAPASVTGAATTHSETAVKLSADQLTQLETSAKSGDADAQLELALAYDDGSAGKPDHAKAAEWYAKAADQNVAVAHLRLGMLLEDGSAGRQSYVEARDHYQAAIAGNVPEANLRLGILYLEGWGVSRDPIAAAICIEKAANADYKPAQLVLSDMYAVGVGVARDLAKAATWAQKAAASNDSSAQARLGALAARQGLPRKDFQLAREWYQLSAEQEYSRAMFGMAGTFFAPGSSPAERETGLRWLRLAAESGNSAAAFYLAGALLATGPDEQPEARKWIQFASDHGEAAATEVLELSKGEKTLRDALRYVLTEPYEKRYVQRWEKRKTEAAANPNGTYPPVPVKIVRPVYPMPLRLTGTQGDVTVSFVVDTTGRVRDPKVVKTDHPAFSDRALEAIQHWNFVPARKDGRVVNTRMVVPLYFRLTDIHDGRKVKTPPAPQGADPGV